MRIHVLSIGNSFSEDAQSYLYDILKSDGIEDVLICNLIIGGCSLEKHYDNAINNLKLYEFRVFDGEGCHVFTNYSLEMGLAYSSFDYITFQQASHFSGIKSSYYYDNGTKSYLDFLKDYCLKNYKGENTPKFLFHMTWAYSEDFKGDTFKNYSNSKEQMEKGIIEVKNEVIKKHDFFSGIIPSFYAIKELVDRGFNPYRDGFHLSLQLGRYTVSLVFAKTVYSESNLYKKMSDPYLTEEEKTISKEIVANLKTY